MRFTWLLFLAACKLHFDPVTLGDGSTADTSGMDIDAAPFGPFGPPQLVGDGISVVGEIEVGPSIGANDLQLYFTTPRFGGFTLWSSERVTKTGPWATPARRVDLDVNGPIEFDAELTIDGLELYYGSNAVPDGVRTTTRTTTADTWPAGTPFVPGAMTTGVALFADDLRMMIGERELLRATRGDPWVAVQSHTTLANIDYVTVSNDGLELFGTDAAQKLYRATRISIDAQFDQPVGFSLGTPFDSAMIGDPELSHDGRTLYFASQFSGDYDIYVTTR